MVDPLLRLARVTLGASLVLAGCSSQPPLDVAKDVDLSQFQGQWYEIAKLPRPTQADCHDTSAYYTLFGDGSMALVNQCHVGSASGPLKSVTMSAKVPDPSVPAKLAVDVGGFYGDYWVLEVGPAYAYAVIGHPSRDYLWILSRTPTLDPTTLEGVESRAQAQHFDTSALALTPQSAEQTPHGPEGDVAPPVGYGCSAVARVGPTGWRWALLAATLLLGRVLRGATRPGRGRRPRAAAP